MTQISGLISLVSPSSRKQVPPRRPDWIRSKAPGGPNYLRLVRLMRGLNLHTVCEEARCPNIGECWEAGTATFMILGDICTRSCGFCAVKTGRPQGLDLLEPLRVAEAVKALKLKHAVITSVNRDELPDGGACIFAGVIREIRARCPETSIEVLIPDFEGNLEALAMVVEEGPDILNHNVETVPRLYFKVRPQAKYWRSLYVLYHAKQMRPEMTTKSGIMVGVGERWEEILQTMNDLLWAQVDILTIGQYLRPSLRHIPVERYYTPEEFQRLKEIGEALGFKHVESGPLVRSSYHAREQLEELKGSKASNS